MPEAGAEYAIKAAKILEDKNVKFIMIGGGILWEKQRTYQGIKTCKFGTDN